MDIPITSPTPRPERADAARNRARVLDAAQRLFAEHGATQVTMEDIAKAAGVGKGTLYRRYPDRSALALALLDQHELRLQENLIGGPPPLGPGAPPAERLAAFYAGMIELLDTHLDLALAAETGAARFHAGAYAFWHAHVRVLLGAAGVDDPHDSLAEILLAPLAGEFYRHLRDSGVTKAQVVDSLGKLARLTCGAGAR